MVCRLEIHNATEERTTRIYTYKEINLFIRSIQKKPEENMPEPPEILTKQVTEVIENYLKKALTEKSQIT